MQDRRDTDSFAHFGQTRAAVNRCRFRGQQPFHGAGNGVAAGGQDDDVIFDQFFDHW